MPAAKSENRSLRISQRKSERFGEWRSAWRLGLPASVAAKKSVPLSRDAAGVPRHSMFDHRFLCAAESMGTVFECATHRPSTFGSNRSMRRAEWIHVVVFCFFGSLSWIRRLPGGRRARVTGLSAAGLGVTLTGAFLLPRLLPALAASVVRDWLPAALILIVYRQAGEFFLRVDQPLQNWLERFDERLVGPLLRWISRRRLRKWIGVYLELAYLLCYPMVPMSVGALYLLRLGSESDHFWSVVLIATYLSYGALPFLQTMPPRTRVEPWLEPLPPNPVRRFNLWILNGASIHANTFPSAHVAASAAAAMVFFQVAPLPVALLFGAIAAGIALGTFTGRYHFAADSIAGILVAVTVFLIVNGVEPRSNPNTVPIIAVNGDRGARLSDRLSRLH